MMIKKIILLLVFAVACREVKAQYVSLSADEIVKLKTLLASDAQVKKTFDGFQATADKALTEQPNPVEEIMSEGLLAGNPDKIRSLKSVEDGNKIYALALVYKVYGGKAYLDKAAEYLLAWAKTNKSSGDPIDETKLEDLFTGYDLVRDDLTADIKKTVDKWLLKIADGELNSEHARGNKGTAVNNWNSHRIKIMAMIAAAIHDEKYDGIIRKELSNQIAINLYADGSGHDFEERDALHYHIYTLEPLIMAATVVYRATGKDYFNYESNIGSSIRKSVDFLTPFITGEKTHGEFLNSRVPFDKARAKNGEKGYQAGAKFKPATGIYVMEEAAYFNSKYMDAIQKGFPDGNAKYDWQSILNSVRKPFVSH